MSAALARRTPAFAVEADRAALARVPVLDRIRNGHIRHIQNIAAQLHGEWAHMGLRNLNDFIDPAAGIHLLEARSLSTKGDIVGLALVGGKPRGFMMKRRAANLVIHKVLANGATEVEVGETI